MEAMRNELKEMEAYKRVYRFYSLSRVEPDKGVDTRENDVKEETDDFTTQMEDKVSVKCG